MTPAKAKVIFATHMQAARKRKLTSYELNQLSTARQVLRSHAKPAMNVRKPATFSKLACMYCGGKMEKQVQSTGHIQYRCLSCGRYRKEVRQRNPKGATLIYGQVDCIYATKKQNHICDDECKKNGHRYFHEFSSKPKMYGLPDGTLLIKP